ncbi:MAG: hypothetical protein K6E53_15885 [Lachnospiraceae bacterium]|nr:hypothetical protein [Lachnospiraceae bacterium]
MSVFQLILIVAFGFIVAEVAKRKGYVRESGELKKREVRMIRIDIYNNIKML